VRALMRSGAGWSTEISRDDSSNTARVRVTHAPGGSEAFARAVDEVIANFSQKLSRRFRVSGGAWRTADVTSVFSRVRTSGVSFQPEYRIRRSTAVALQAHTTSVNAVTSDRQPGAVALYGGSEREIGAIANTNLNCFYFRGEVAFVPVTRSVCATSP
jgi:hypothetical protein